MLILFKQVFFIKNNFFKVFILKNKIYKKKFGPPDRLWWRGVGRRCCVQASAWRRAITGGLEGGGAIQWRCVQCLRLTLRHCGQPRGRRGDSQNRPSALPSAYIGVVPCRGVACRPLPSTTPPRVAGMADGQFPESPLRPPGRP